jgi:transcriptional regulator with XRE-family HTH domain
MATDNVLGERAKELRQQLGMTQGDVVEALARRGIEVKQAHVSNIESGARLPSFEVVIGLADVYETSVDYLVGVTDNALSARDMERELQSGGVAGRLGQLLGSMSDRARNELLSIAEAFVYQEMMDIVLSRIEELGGDAALHETIDILEMSRPGAALLLTGRRLLPAQKPVQ